MKTKFFLIATSLLMMMSCNGLKKQSAEVEEMPSASEELVPDSMMQVLVLLAHPHIEQSSANAALCNAASEVSGVQVVNVCHYPMSVDLYEPLVRQAKALVFQFPFWWGSAPSDMKRWTDEVFHELVHRDAIAGHLFMVVTTTGSPEDAYSPEGRNHYTINELLLPFQLQSNYSKMIWQEPLVVFGQGVDGKEERLVDGCELYKQRLRDLIEVDEDNDNDNKE